MKKLMVGTYAIGADQAPFVVADLARNHDGDLGKARALVDAAAEAGVQAVRFPYYRAGEIMDVPEGADQQWALLQRYQVDKGFMRELVQHAHRQKLLWYATPASPRGVAEVVDAGAVVLHCASAALNNLPLIAAMARSTLPTALACGNCDWDTIYRAVFAYEIAGGKKLILLHGSPELTLRGDLGHLRRIVDLRERFPDAMIGYSDYGTGTAAALEAARLGATWVQKRLTLDRNASGPDHVLSAEPPVMGTLVAEYRKEFGKKLK